MPFIVFKGEKIEIPEGVKVSDWLKENRPEVYKKAVVLRKGDKLLDLASTLSSEEEAEILTDEDPESLEVLRHSTAHLMAQAVKHLFPDAKVTIGPAIENGFYYDFDVPEPFTPEDLKKIEKEMKKLASQKIPIVREEIPREEAIKMFREMREDYKVEIIEEIDDEKVSIYRQGDFVDLCRGPHLDHTGRIKHFKLLSVAGAYWRGDERNKMLSRIYGTAFFKKEDLDNYLKFLEEARKRDHRKLGKELDLFSFNEHIGPGLVLWHPRGARIRRIMEDFWVAEHYKNGYELLYTPHIAREDLWRISGHLDFYAEHMFKGMEVEGQRYLVKPMNCPFHIQIYKTKKRSYRDLPFRWAELGTVYRYEKSGVLHGLLRVRGFTQDDAHIFCTPEQLEDEIIEVIRFSLKILRTFGFEDFHVFLSTRPEKYVGTLENWERATEALKIGLEKAGLKYDIDPGEGVFYGPKIDIKIKDSLGREWQCSTIQVDFNLPERFDMTYIGPDGKEHRPIMIHRALMGSFERFFGTLIEHYAGAFPMWLAPEQVVVLPLSEKFEKYAEKIYSILREEGIRVVLDNRSESLGYRIRDNQKKKVPVMVIVGEKEESTGTISLRWRDGKQEHEVKVEEFIARIREIIDNKT